MTSVPLSPVFTRIISLRLESLNVTLQKIDFSVEEKLITQAFEPVSEELMHTLSRPWSLMLAKA